MSGATWVLKIAETTIYAVRNRFWPFGGSPVAAGWAQGGRRWLSGVPQVAVRGRLGTRIGVHWPIWTPKKAPKGFTAVALGRLNASPRPARDISKAETNQK